jgi:hypothetical protein
MNFICIVLEVGAETKSTCTLTLHWLQDERWATLQASLTVNHRGGQQRSALSRPYQLQQRFNTHKCVVNTLHMFLCEGLHAYIPVNTCRLICITYYVYRYRYQDFRDFQPPYTEYHENFRMQNFGCEKVSTHSLWMMMQSSNQLLVLVGSARIALQPQCWYSSVKQGQKNMSPSEPIECMLTYSMNTPKLNAGTFIPSLLGKLKKRGYNGVNIRISTLTACTQR